MLRNRDLAELLSREAQRALRRVARAALWRWTEEAAELHAQGRSLTELALVGPWLATIMRRWIASHSWSLASPPRSARVSVAIAS